VTPLAFEFPLEDRRECARSLSPARRLALLASFGRGRGIRANASGRTYPELHGLHRYQRWLTQSGRVADDGGSAWWSEVNGLLLLDMAESATLSPGATGGRSEPVRAWTNYWTNRAKEHRTRLCWEAHQSSLEAGVRAAEGLLALEPPSERDFITIALSSVEIASLANLPTGRGGSNVVGGFCRVFYPAGYPAEDGSGTRAQSLLSRATGGSHPGLRIAAGVIRGSVAR
jgi:hypothetical protein